MKHKYAIPLLDSSSRDQYQVVIASRNSQSTWHQEADIIILGPSSWTVFDALLDPIFVNLTRRVQALAAVTGPSPHWLESVLHVPRREQVSVLRREERRQQVVRR